MIKFNYNANAEVDEQKVADLLCSGFEGGIGYWATIVGYKKPENVFKWDLVGSIGGHYPYVQYPLSEGGAVLLKDSEGDSERAWTLDLESIKTGLTTMANKYPRHYRNFIEDNSDSETGDVFIQCCLFGEIVYG